MRLSGEWVKVPSKSGERVISSVIGISVPHTALSTCQPFWKQKKDTCSIFPSFVGHLLWSKVEMRLKGTAVLSGNIFSFLVTTETSSWTALARKLGWSWTALYVMIKGSTNSKNTRVIKKVLHPPHVPLQRLPTFPS